MRQLTTVESLEAAREAAPQYFEAELNGNARFWVGKVSVEGCVINASQYDDVGRFRADKYVRDFGFLPENSVDAEGREFDSDDERSTQFAVIEKQGIDTRVVGSGRLIHKRSQQDLLPVEKYFPEAFSDGNGVSVGDVEVSRFIASHENPQTQHLIGLAVIRALTFHSNLIETERDYAIVERPLASMLSGLGIPVEELAETKDIPELGGKLLPISIDTTQIVDSLQERSRRTVLLRKFFKSEIQSNGLGHYGDNLIGAVK